MQDDRPPEATSRPPLLPPGLGDVFRGVLAIVAGVAAHVFMPAAVLTCARGADGATSCVIQEQIFFGALSTSRETIDGVTGARTIHWDNGSKADDYSVALVTERGEHELGVLSSFRNSSEVTRAVIEHVERGASRVEAVLHPALGRQMQRVAFLLVGLAGGWFVVHGVRRVRHRPDARVPSRAQRS